jgi:hypothetical protein
MSGRTSKQQNLAAKRKPSRLTTTLDKNLVAYALAAGAAGMGVLALVEPAEAHILATPVNIPITVNTGIIEFDLNRDGIPDFGLSANFYEFARVPPLGGFSSLVRVVPAQTGNEVWAVSSHGDECAAAVHAGLPVDGKRPFMSGPLIMLIAAGSYTRGRTSHCGWNGANPPFLGLKFMIDGQVHYGWARVTSPLRSVVLTGFAYETIPNKPIIAGATRDEEDDSAPAAAEDSAVRSTPPASLGMLAMGSAGLTASRK